MMQTDKIRIVLVDDHPLVLEGIIARLEDESSLEVVGSAHDGARAIDIVAEIKPDVVLMDISMPVMNGFEATSRLCAEHSGLRVLILSMHESREYIQKIMHCGAAGYVLKDVSAGELITAIKTVHRGENYFSAGASASLSSRRDVQSMRVVSDQVETLTNRESEVLRLLAGGASNKDVAQRLNISVRTAETHRQNIKTKLNVQTAAGLVRYAIENKIID